MGSHCLAYRALSCACVFRVPFLKALSLFFLSLVFGVVLPGDNRVSLAYRCRRFLLCRTMSSYTSSYPDRCANWHRPLCLACMTATTEDSAPSNGRVRLAPASCSYGQESPGRNGFHALYSGSCQWQNLGSIEGIEFMRVSSPGPRTWPGPCASAIGQSPADGPARWRLFCAWIFRRPV